MKKILLGIFILSFWVSFGQTNCDPKDFELLKSGSRKTKLTDFEFLSYLKTVKLLESNRCFDYVQKRNGREYIETGLTYLLGQLCLAANSNKSVVEYINYLNRHLGSAEEQRSFSFEYLFKQNPKRVLSIVNSDTTLLDHVAWGFMNNRLYGVDDPYQNDPNKEYTAYYKEPKRVLTIQAFKDIFYKTYPSLKNDTIYSKQIEYLLNSIYDGLKEQE